MVLDEYTTTSRKLRKLCRIGDGSYLREVPFDPMTGSNQSWKIEMKTLAKCQPVERDLRDPQRQRQEGPGRQTLRGVVTGTGLHADRDTHVV